MSIRLKSLVLYKNKPALILNIGDKLEITLDTGKTIKVREKDITLLHPGPLAGLHALTQPPGDIETAWELLAGQTVTLAELAELAFDEFTPATAWAAWQLAADGLYFKGPPEAIEALPPEAVAAEKESRAAKIVREEIWTEFIGRIKSCNIIADDGRLLRDVEDLALGRILKSRVLHELGRVQSPENAHALLLELDYWDETVNPYPVRLNMPADTPPMPLPPLPNEDRLNLTHLPAFAIDDTGSEDPDDALSLDGNRLWVHVADPAALVSPHSPVDVEAQARIAKLYLPEMSVPMLPPQATETLALGLQDVSPALSFGFDVSQTGQSAPVEIIPSWVRVTRMTYEEAETRLDEEPLASMHRLARQFYQRRLKNGAVEIYLPEVKVKVKDDRVVIQPILNLQSRLLVRESMLMVGEAVARFSLEHDVPLPFSAQEVSEPGEPLPEGMAGMFALRRTMKRSQLTGVPAPHTGLGLDMYVQATSPLRRYLDLVVHQQLRAWLTGTELLDSAAILARVGAAESITGSVRQAERLSNKHWTLVYLLQNPTWSGTGILVEIRGKRGAFILPDLDLITWIHLKKEIPLNSEVTLQFKSADLPGQEAHFRIIKE